MKNQNGLAAIIIVGLVLVLLSVGGIYLILSKNKDKNKDTNMAVIDTVATPSKESATKTNPEESVFKKVLESDQTKTTDTSETQSTEVIFADKLSSCSKYKTTFKHPFTGDILEKEILGVINGRCSYYEQMPNNGKMECKYSEEERAEISKYYKDLAESQSYSTSIKINSEGTKATYTINGKVVENPLQEMLGIGVCVVSGY